MGLLGKLFGKTKNVLDVTKKITNKDALKAVVAMCVATAYADGSCDDAEIITMTELIKRDETMSAFSESEIEAEVERFKKQYEISSLVGQKVAEKAVKEFVTTDTDLKEMVALMAFAVAKADGTVDDKEKKVLTEFAKILNVNIAQYFDKEI